MTNREILITIVAALIIGGMWFYLNPGSMTNDEAGEQTSSENTNTDQSTPTANTSTGQTKTTNTTQSAPKTTVNTTPVTLGIIEYTNAGFSPTTLSVRVTGVIRFVNKSDKAMRVTGFRIGEDQYTTVFDSEKSVPRGGTFEFNVPQAGVWSYKNVNYESHTGVFVAVP